MTKQERDLRVRIFEELIAELPRAARPNGAGCIDLIGVREWLREKIRKLRTGQVELAILRHKHLAPRNKKQRRKSARVLLNLAGQS